MFSDLFQRKSRRSLLIEFNPSQVLVAVVSRPVPGPVVISAAAEFEKDDDVGLQLWLDGNFGRQKSRIPAICGFVPSQGLMRRETVQPAKLAKAENLAALLREKFKVENPDDWRVRLVNPLEGTPLASENPTGPALICGVPDAEVRAIQQRLFDRGLRPIRLEPSRLASFGGIFDQIGHRDDKRAAVVVDLTDEQTNAYILGKEGVHTPSPVRHGLHAVFHAARRELGLPDDADVRALLSQPDDEIRFLAPKFMRVIGRDLKPMVDSYEMTTGQPAGGIYCPYLPADLAWLAEPLALSVERPSIPIDCADWLPTVGLRTESGMPPLGQHWIAALSLIAEYPGQTHDKPRPLDDQVDAPWHFDCGLAAESANKELIGRRFVTGTVALALAALAVTVTVWQVYVSNSLRADTNYWEAEMAKNQKLFDELTRAASDRQERFTRLDHAFTMMASPYHVSDFVLNLGRTLPRNMRIDRIELSQGRISISGGLREPSESASGILNRYLEELRRSPAIGPIFSSIGLTALQREATSDALAFEITFKVKVPQP